MSTAPIQITSIHPSEKRSIRSFVRREGRITPLKQHLIETVLPQYQLKSTRGELSLATVFSTIAPLTLEIGFGNGECLFRQAQENPSQNYMGIEVYVSGALTLLKQLKNLPLPNIKLLLGDIIEILPYIPNQSFDCIQIFFPDPWPKTRHYKRRLIQPNFINALRLKLKLGGKFYLATDWEPYAHHMLKVLENAPGWLNLAGEAHFSTRPPLRPLTKFEKRGLALNHTIWDLSFLRQQ